MISYWPGLEKQAVGSPAAGSGGGAVPDRIRDRACIDFAYLNSLRGYRLVTVFARIGDLPKNFPLEATIVHSLCMRNNAFDRNSFEHLKVAVCVKRYRALFMDA